MPIASDFTVDYVNKRVYHSSGTTVYSVNALYSYLQDTFDELTQLDDTIPMSAQTPTDYTLINGWFVDDTSIQFLKGGSIQTSGWASGVIRSISYNATGAGTALASGDIGRTITGGTTSDTGVILAYDERYGTELGVIVIRPTVPASDLFNDNDEAFTITGGTGSGIFSATFDAAGSRSGENLWPNVYTLGSIEQDDSQQIYIIQNEARITEWWPDAGTRQIDVLIKTKEMGTEIANGVITVFLRHYPAAGTADLYDHFIIDLTAGGRNAVPLATSPDLNNITAHATVSGYSDISVVWVNATIAYSAISGTFTNFETVTGSSSGATGKFLYQTTATGAGTMTIGNITGAFTGADTITGGSSAQTATASAGQTIVNEMNKAFTLGTNNPYSVIIGCATRPLAQVYEYLKYITRYGGVGTPNTYPTFGTETVSASLTINPITGEQYITAYIDSDTPANTWSPVKASPFGTFAGGKFFGARGVWVENMATSDVQAFQLIDSDNVTQTPPNQIFITVTNTIASDRVAVFLTTGAGSTTINKDQFTSGAGNVTTNTTYVASASIPSDTPLTGSIRLVDVSDTSASREVRHTYTSWSGATFSGLSPALDKEYTNATDKAYVPYIDQEATTTSVSVSVIYVANRNVLVRIRRYTATAILPFETTGTITSTGYSVSTIRTTDTIVS